MAAASSGDPGGTVGRRLPLHMDPTNKFGELTYLQLIGKDGAQLPKNPFLIGKSVEIAAGGSIEGANTEAQGKRYTLKIRDPSQVSRLLTMKTLVDGTEVVVQAHPNLNVSRCVISCFDLINMEEKDVLSELANQNVMRVHRITRKDGDRRVNTPALILTFCKTTYPERIKIGLLHVATRPYFPNPMLCYGCFSYGHTRARCPGPQRCFNCSAEQHGEECNAKQFCRNCKGDHRPTSRQCPMYKNETEVIKIKVRDNITFPEARKRAEQLNKGSYAQAASQQNGVELKLKEFEANMQQKDGQIAKLLEKIQQKDERMVKMFDHIQQLRQQITTLEQAQHSKEPQKAKHQTQQQSQHQTQQLTGPITRSRNSSPATHESKRGRPSKQSLVAFNRPPANSSDEHSPPPKKFSTTKEPPADMVYSDDEGVVEITETPPN